MSELLSTVSTIAFAQPTARQEMTLPTGMTVEQMVEIAVPGMKGQLLELVRVTLVTKERMSVVPRDVWHLVKPRAGVHIVIRVLAGKGSLKSILTVLVAVAAAVIASFIVGPYGLAIGNALVAGIVKSGITLGLTALGGILITALLPAPAAPTEVAEKPAYAISGWRNELRPDAPFPLPLGEIRYAPPFATYSYTEVVGDDLYDRGAVIWGIGRVLIDELKIGETLIEGNYDEVTHSSREGVAGDAPLTIVTNQVIQDAVGTELTRPVPRDDLGEFVKGGVAVSKPVTRFTAADADEIVIILSFPTGLVQFDDEGEDKPESVSIAYSYRLVGVEPWSAVETIDYKGERRASFFRDYRKKLPARGRYEIRAEMITPETTSDQKFRKVVWQVLQTVRPEYPFNTDLPLALTEFRIKATDQLNGTLDTINGRVRRHCLDWDSATEAWIARPTRRPASLARFLLQGPHTLFPVPDNKIDFPAFEDWHDFCVLHDLNYNRVHDFDGGLREALAAVGAAGRAVVRERPDGSWTVVIDRPRDLVVDMVNSRNASNFQWSTDFFDPPDAIRVKFQDQTNDYQAGERLIPWPDGERYELRTEMEADLDHYEDRKAQVYGDPVPSNNGFYRKVGAEGVGSWAVSSITEEMEHPGKTDPDEIWIETVRRCYELLLRSTTYSAEQSGLARVTTTGDKVMAARDVRVRSMHSARVRDIRGQHVEIDDFFTIEEGIDYGIGFHLYEAEDVVGRHVVRPIRAPIGDVGAFNLIGDLSEVPVKGKIINFGPLSEVSIPVIVSRIERGQGDTSIITMLPAAEELDALVAALPPPIWSGRVGADIGGSDAVPTAPRFIRISTGTIGTGSVDGIEVILAPGLGSVAVVGSYRIRHRLDGDVTWLGPVVTSASSSGAAIPGHLFGQTVELQAQAVSINGVEGPWGPIVEVIVGAEDLEPDFMLDFSETKNGMYLPLF